MIRHASPYVIITDCDGSLAINNVIEGKIDRVGLATRYWWSIHMIFSKIMLWSMITWGSDTNPCTRVYFERRSTIEWVINVIPVSLLFLSICIPESRNNLVISCSQNQSHLTIICWSRWNHDSNPHVRATVKNHVTRAAHTWCPILFGSARETHDVNYTVTRIHEGELHLHISKL